MSSWNVKCMIKGEGSYRNDTQSLKLLYWDLSRIKVLLKQHKLCYTVDLEKLLCRIPIYDILAEFYTIPVLLQH